MVSCQKPSPLKGRKHSQQCHPHDAALLNALSFVSMGVEARCCPCHSAAHRRHMERQPCLCHHHPCRGRLHCNCRCAKSITIAVAVAHCRRPWPLLLRLPLTIAAAVSVALLLAIAIAVAIALAIGHCHLHNRRPLQLPSLLAITIIVAVGHF
jgi:hypothetical protein